MKSSVLLAAIFFAQTTLADNLKICFESWRPYAEIGANKVAEGSTIDFWNEAAKKAGHSIEWVKMPPERCWVEVKSGKMSGSLFGSPGDHKELVYTKTITEYWLVAAIVNAANPMTKFNGIDEFKGKSVGTTSGYSYPEALKGFAGLKIEETPDASNSLRKLDAGRIDVTFDDPVWADFESKSNKFKLKILPPVVAQDPTYLVLGPTHKALADSLDKAAAELIKGGSLDKLYQKYQGISFADFKKRYGL